MSAVDERINGWFALARSISSETGWEVAAAQPEGRLLHCARASGGRLIKFDFDSIVIEETGHLNPEEVVVRPELRGLFYPHSLPDMQFRTVQILAPGFAMINLHLQQPVLRPLAQGAVPNGRQWRILDFFEVSLCASEWPALAWHQLRRSHPEPGMCTAAILQERRGAGKRFYIILSLRNFNRGPPMLPSDGDDGDGVTVTISGGEERAFALGAPTLYRKE
eukprot:Skav228729  [mRNA]  locus=scaffold1830:510591:518122:- [translate_table: standard]